MTEGLGRITLRSGAIVIAVAAAIDPLWTLSRPVPQSVIVAHLASSAPSTLDAAIRAAFPEARVDVRTATSGRLPCRPGDRCLMVADGSIDVEIPDDVTGPVSLVTLAAPPGSNIAVQSVASSRTQQAGGSGTVRVTLSGTGTHGRRTELRVADGGATVGTAIHDWKTDGAAAVDVPWWPLGEGPRTLTVAAVPFEGEASLLDNAVDVGVVVSTGRIPVLVFDVRPSWASTFVRRALEDDTRFQVEHRVRLGPSLAAGTAGGRLDSRTLDAAAVVIIGGPDGLSSNDVTLLERYVQVRGGTLLLLPDRALAGPPARLFPGQWSEHLEASASPVGALRASETLRLAAGSPFDVVLATVKGGPTVVLSPVANGRIVISGAMDAWRYRDSDAGAFDRFWRSLVLETAAAGASLRLEFERTIAALGGEVPFVVRHLQMEPDLEGTISATATCGDQPSRVIRLWPGGTAGMFRGRMSIGGRDACQLRVSVDGGPSVVGGVAVTTGATDSVSGVMAKLERAALSTGGAIASAPGETTVAAALTPVTPVATQLQPIRPMRSPWWMFPFVTFLSVEWWLRRRAGLR